MSDQTPTSIWTHPPAARPFFDTWLAALTRPRPSTYEWLARGPNATAKGAFSWVFGAALAAFGIAALGSLWGIGQNPAEQEAGATSNLVGADLGGGIIAVLVFAIFVGVAHVLARLFGGQATFGQLSYALAAIEAPYTILSAVFSLLAATPLIGIAFEVLAYGRGIYIIVIQAIAVKGVHRISWAGAFVAAWALPLLLVAGFAACLLVFGLAALAAGAFSALGPLPSP